MPRYEFQSTRLREARLDWLLIRLKRKLFQSTRLREARRYPNHFAIPTKQFQSTRLREARQEESEQETGVSLVSIHAPA